MWLSSEDARSDFILAVAATVLGRFTYALVVSIPFYPGGLVGASLDLLWLAALTGLAPYLLARYRRDVPGAFGMGPKQRGPVAPGLVLAVPFLVAHLLPYALDGDVTSLGLGVLGRLYLGSPPIADLFRPERLILVGAILILLVGTWLFATFLSVRAREAFRSPDMDVTEALRTYGMAGVGATFLLGLLRALTGLSLFDGLLLGGLALAVVLLTDRYVPPRLTATRATVLAPAIAVVALHVLAAGGLFRGDLLQGLHRGAGGAVVMIATTSLLEAKRGWAATLLVFAAVLYTVGDSFESLSPLPLFFL